MTRATIGPYAHGVALTGPATRRVVRPTEDPAPLLHPASRVARGARTEDALLAAERGFVADGLAAIGPGPRWSGLARDALLDVHALSRGLPAPVAGWNANWRYVWPRDAAHAIVLLARTGRADEAIAALDFLARRQRPDGWFEARYRPDGTVPDARPRQSDGAGWFLWAAAEALGLLPGSAGRIAAVAGPAAGRAIRAIVADVRRAGPLTTPGLPSPSPDYWERREARLTLGTAAPVLAGLQAAGRAGGELCAEAARAPELADSLARAIRAHFGPGGYRRHGGPAARLTSGHDVALAFLLPPYVTGFEADAGPLLADAWASMRRPAGGIAPGARWRERDLAWTPATALFGQAWAFLGESGRAAGVLGWLDAHRTVMGSLPEKVGPDGSPAAVAPLAWTACLALSTLGRLPH